MKNILKKMALLAVPVVVWFAFFAAFERVTGINVAARYAAEIVRSMEKRRGASSGS